MQLKGMIRRKTVLYIVILTVFIELCMSKLISRGRLHYGGRGILRPQRRTPANQRHAVTFASKLKNADRLEQILYDVSDPDSPNYGKHWTRAQLGSFLQNEEGSRRLREYLVGEGVTIISATPYDELITAEASIGTWERVFGTEFHEFVHEDWKGSVMNRALEYSLSEEINEYVESVFEVVDMLPAPERNWKLSTASLTGGLPSADLMTPNLLYSTYSIDPSLGNSFTTQAAAQCLDHTVRPLDIAAFQTFFSLPQQSLDLGSSIGGHVTNSACKNSIDDCVEASLDYQYIMAVGRNVPTSAMYWEGCSWLTLLRHLQTLPDPPKVLSISYSSYETDLGANYVSAFNIVAMQLGVLGVTFLASSGDDGVAGFKARTDASKCGYGPQFPASSPYVTAVGATLGPETGSTEIGCSVDAGGEVTSGGGFSVFSRFQSWQTTAISQYFLGVVQTPYSPVRGYSTNGRGYPDISAAGNKYAIVVNDSFVVVSGTSASSPVVAGMVSLVNAARAKAGQPTLGFLNPFLYTRYTSFVRDISSGNNLCTENINVCCTQGFYATSGWDPVTGLGVLNFTAFYETAMNLQLTFNPTAAPTIAPTAAPTRTSELSAAPTIAPTRQPPLIQFIGVQTIDYVNMTALILNISRNAIVIPETVIVSIPDADQLNVSDVNIYTVDSSANTRRQLRNQQVSLTAGATEVGSINVNYTVTIKSMTKDYAYFANELRTAVVNQLFTLQMRLIADQYDASAFYNATSSNVTIIAVVTPETKKTTEKEFYQTYVVPLAIGLIFILSMALFIGFICCMRRQKSIQKKYRVHIDTDNNSEHG